MSKLIGNKNPSFRHGKTKTRTYRCWSGMLTRCSNKNTKQWKDYGGRGIKFDKRWRDFCNFLEDMGECPEGHSLDRIDVNKGYNKKNCRWATHDQQVRNARSNLNITYAGKTMCVAEWAREMGINKYILRYRFHAGWDTRRLFSKPSNGGNKNPICPWK